MLAHLKIDKWFFWKYLSQVVRNTVRSFGFPVGEHWGRPIVQSVEQYFFHIRPSLSQRHFTFLQTFQIPTIFHPAFTSSFVMTLPLCNDTFVLLGWHLSTLTQKWLLENWHRPFSLSNGDELCFINLGWQLHYFFVKNKTILYDSTVLFCY